ncbi:MAG: cysteine synthase A [Elusimicrobiaceae bacterium]
MQNPNGISQFTGNTPLIRLKKTAEGLGAGISVKAEFFNPTSSVKDRAAKFMVRRALASGGLKPGGEIIEPTSGNTGIALAMICACSGIKLTLAMPDTMSVERRHLLTFFGAELVLTPGALGMAGAVAKSKELARARRAVILDQFSNPANPQAHEETTGPEIWAQTDRKIDIFLAGVGTGGTVTGAGRFLKRQNPEIKVFAVEPQESPVLSGGKPGPHKIQGIGAGFVPDNMDMAVLNGIVTVTAEEAGAMARRLAKEEGILCGISSGANVAAALKLAARPENAGKEIVTIICDTGERYLSTWLFKGE